ncbi:MAG: glycosyltransferase family 39 protein, partial [Anaerolineae bacterium]|nr:glycosyltransferase family 39 protein [Anaerolineae bacterium]
MRPRNSYKQWSWILFVLLALLFAQSLDATIQLSATVDEPFHIISGYEYLRTGELRLFDEHAPLAKALFAWPLFFVPDLPTPETAADYASGNLIAVTQATLLAYRPLERVIVAPRVAAALLTVLLAATLFRCATSFAGPSAGLLALALCVCDPNFVAHGSLATTDMGATAFSFWALWAGMRWLQRPTWRRCLLAALMLGLAQGVKLTALLLYPILGIGVLLGTAARRRQGVRVLRVLLGYAGIVGVSLLVLWALYGCEVRPVAGVLGGVSLPAASHIERWLRLQSNLAYGRESFLLGQNGMHGWVQYFPIAFLLKTPLPILILLCVVLLREADRLLRFILGFSRLALRTPRFTSYVSHFTFYLFPFIYALASLTSPLNIGYRHLLPVLPFLYVGIAQSVWRMAHGKYLSRFVLSGLLAWLALGTLRIAPYHLAFFNALAGGSDNGWRFLADSNTDWGQTFKVLADYQIAHEIEPVRLSAFTFYDPAAYGVDYVSIAPMTGAPPVLPRRFNPEAGVYAISATTLDGVPLPYPPTFNWFRYRDPFVKLGHAMFLYAVQPFQGTWIAQCSHPVAPLSEEAIDEGFGILGLRSITFDCEQSWVLPGDTPSPGWFARAIPAQTRLRWPTEDAVRADLLPAWLVDAPLHGLTLSYLQPGPGE